MVSLISCISINMYQLQKRFLPQKVLRYSFPASSMLRTQDPFRIGPATFQTFEALGTAPQPFGWSSHPVRRQKHLFFQPVNFLPTRCILPMWWRDLVLFLNKWRMICWISGDFRTWRLMLALNDHGLQNPCNAAIVMKNATGHLTLEKFHWKKSF